MSVFDNLSDSTAAYNATEALTTARNAKITAEAAQARANTAQATATAAETIANNLKKYINFITDMQQNSTILAWAKQNTGISIGMQITPYAPADGPQTKVTPIVEWNIVILAQPGNTSRQTVLAFSYGGANTTVLKRCAFNGAWLGDWQFVQN